MLKFLFCYFLLCLLAATVQGARVGKQFAIYKAQGRQNISPNWIDLFFQFLNPCGVFASIIAEYLTTKRMTRLTVDPTKTVIPTVGKTQ